MAKTDYPNTNLLDSTMERIRFIENSRAEKLNDLTIELETTYSAIESQRKRVTEAAASTDLEAYRHAQKKLKELQESAKTLEQWKQDLERSDKVTEKESEDTIAALLSYEHKQVAEYMKAAGKLMIELKTLTEKHIEDSLAAERVLYAWTSRVRANYIDPSTIFTNEPRKLEEPKEIHPFNGYKGWVYSPFILQDLMSRGIIRDLMKAASEE